MKHPSGIDQNIVDKIVGRRGRLHAYPSITPKQTALVVVDLDVGTVGRMAEEVSVPTMIGRINEVGAVLRQAGGVVAWVLSPSAQYKDNARALLGESRAQMYRSEASSAVGQTLYPDLDVLAGDARATKQGYSAFFPGKSDLHEQLQARHIDTVLFAGTVTNVCCESSARDAYELEYKVVMISDLLKGHSYGLHEASLATIFRNFGDVRLSGEIIELLRPVR